LKDYPLAGPLSGLIQASRSRAPLFSVCIPQYNRTSFLLKCLESFSAQSFRDFEVCISDGGSNDGRHPEVFEFLTGSGLDFRCARSRRNLPYDANLRSSLALARGRYCLLFGNDDKLAATNSLERISAVIERWGFPEVVLSNYLELPAGLVMRRIRRTGLLGSGPQAAAANFRNFSFVSGLFLQRERAQRLTTQKWDGSEVYQMYLASRIVAEGGRLLGIDEVLVHKNIQIPGEQVDSYARRPNLPHCRIEERLLPLCQYARVALDAVSGSISPARRGGFALRIFSQVLVFTYPPWLVEYRRVQSWRFAAGIAWGMRPRNILGSGEPGWFVTLYVRVLYVLATFAGLLVPTCLYNVLRPWLYRLAKKS